MYNKLCERCIHHCKQDESAKIMQCPRFQKRLTDNEFKDLIDELDTMETKATELRKRTRELIRIAQNAESDDSDENTEVLNEPQPEEVIDNDSETEDHPAKDNE